MKCESQGFDGSKFGSSIERRMEGKDEEREQQPSARSPVCDGPSRR